MSNAPQTDTSDMVPVHQVFRKALGSAPELLHPGVEGDGDRVALLTSYYANVLSFLESHHGGEDALVYPLLLERVPAEQRDLVAEVGGEHTPLHASLEAAHAAVAAFAADPDDAHRQAAAESLATLDAELTPHLDHEEDKIVPIAAVYLSPEEWGALPGHGMAHFTGDKIWLILGLIRENMSDEQRAQMLAHMPPPAVDMWTNMGNAAFDQMIAEVRQSA
jgi:hemerythrin-like domain-containing protein